MFNQSLRRAARPAFAFTVLLLTVPSFVSAQAPAVPKTSEAVRKSVIVTVDYVEATLPVLEKASHGIAAGPQHDAQLLAALVKNGAVDTKGITVQCTNGGISDFNGPVVLALGATGRKPEQYLESQTKVAPHFNADGTIAVTLTLRLHSPDLSAVPDLRVDATPTFRVGQTLELGHFPALPAAGRQVYLVFARVAAAEGAPALSDGFRAGGFGGRPLPVFVPPLVDPGMVNNLPFDGDPGMVNRGGIDPESIDHMNGLGSPPVVVPNRK